MTKILALDESFHDAIQFARDDDWDGAKDVIEPHLNMDSERCCFSDAQLQQLCVENIRATLGLATQQTTFLLSLWRAAARHDRHDAVCGENEDPLLFVLERTCDKALVGKIIDCIEEDNSVLLYMRLNKTSFHSSATLLGAVGHRLMHGSCRNPHCADDQVAITKLLLKKGAWPDLDAPEVSPFSLLESNPHLPQTPLVHLAVAQNDERGLSGCLCRIANEHFLAGADPLHGISLLLALPQRSRETKRGLRLRQMYLAEILLGQVHSMAKLRGSIQDGVRCLLASAKFQHQRCGRIRAIRLAFRWLLKKRFPPWLVGMVAEFYILSCVGIHGLIDLIDLRFALQHEMQPSWRKPVWMGRRQLIENAKWSSEAWRH